MSKTIPPITDILCDMKLLEIPYLPKLVPRNVEAFQDDESEQQNDSQSSDDSNMKDGESTKTRDKFSAEEDYKLRHIVALVGTKNWKLVALHMQTKNVRQCRDRWKNYLNPALNNGLWTQDEDNIIINKFLQVGSRWHIIAQFLNGRSPNSVRNRMKQLRKIHYIPNSYLTNF